jgi:hypothetical protein
VKPFTGNCPRNVSRDAKYAIRWVGGELQASLVYRHPNGEEWLAATSAHPRLVKLVNEVKVEATDTPGGPFYINEYRQVLVPTGAGADYYLAGEFDGRLEFKFEEHTLSGDAVDLEGNPLVPGQRWVGPHPGIPYILTAKNDIGYEVNPRPNVTRRVLLSEQVGASRSREIATQVMAVKGSSGRFYVNEFAQMFAPVGTTLPLEYVYIGRLDLDAGWFPKVE